MPQTWRVLLNQCSQISERRVGRQPQCFESFGWKARNIFCLEYKISQGIKDRLTAIELDSTNLMGTVDEY
jgi:hypothetical protein